MQRLTLTKRLLGLGAAIAALGAPSTASAVVPIEQFSASTSTSVAGAHPDFSLDLRFEVLPTPAPGFTLHPPVEQPRNLQFDLPAGLIGDPTAVPNCDPVQFLGLVGCPFTSQVGIAKVGVGFEWTTPVWLLPPALPGETARLAIRPGTITPLTISVRPRSEGDFGLRATAIAPSYNNGLSFIQMTLWGDPASAAHDQQRLNGFGSGICGDDYSDPANPVPLPCPYPSTTKTTAFMTNPTSCEPLDPVRVRVSSWMHPGDFVEGAAPLPPLTDCASVPLSPSVTVTPDDSRADKPSGYTVKVTVPQSDAPGGIASSHVRKVDLTLPQGVVISPAGANGLETCADEGLKLAQDAAAACPGASSIATAKIDVPLLDEPLQGEVYLRPPTPGHLFRLAIVADGPGIHLKILGEATPDPVTGQLRAVFDNAPQQPFSALELHFDGGAQAALANPQECGVGAASGTVLGWNGITKPVSSDVSIDQGCAPRGFGPAVSAGSSDSGAAKTTGFNLIVRRGDGEQGLRGIDAQLPAGLSAYVKSVPLCGGGDAAAGTCPADSRIGSATAGAGSGPAPLFLGGGAYLTEGYGGAPYGMSFVVPAKVGPFDLGNVNVRARVFVDRSTAALRVRSDDLPTIIQGVPLRLRELRIAIDRPGFILNPTSCAAKTVGVTTSSIEGATSSTNVPFAASGCKALPFSPTVKAETNGKRYKGSGASLKVGITQPAGQTNLAKVAVRLPEGLAARGTTIRSACSADAWAANACPAKNRAGSAKATTPILGEPLTGGVYFVSRPKGQSGLPQLRMVLRGAGLEVELVGDVTVSKDGSTNTTFAAVPDVPITAFEMDLPQGPNSLLESNRALCSAGALAMRTDLRGQNGARRVRNVAVKVTGCKTAKRKRTKGAGAKRAAARPAANSEGRRQR